MFLLILFSLFLLVYAVFCMFSVCSHLYVVFFLLNLFIYSILLVAFFGCCLCNFHYSCLEFCVFQSSLV